MNSTKRITALAFMIFLFNGVICMLPGVVVIAVAKSFHVETHVIGYIYTLFVLGNAAAVQLNGKLLDKVDIRWELIGASVVTLFSVAMMTVTESLVLFAVMMLFFGLANGLYISAASYFIVSLYEDKNRSAKMSLLHFFFSAGAIVSPLSAGLLLERGVSWQTIYLYALSLLILLLIIIWITPVQVRQQEGQKAAPSKERWEWTIYAVAMSLFCYLIAEGSFLFWAPTYFVEYLHTDAAKAGSLLSLFWLFMAVGRGLSGIVLKKIAVETYILACSFFAFTASMVVLYSANFFLLIIAISGMGLGFSGLYAAILSYGTQQRPYPSARLMSMIMTAGYIGGMTASPFSSFLKQQLDLKASLTIAESFMALVFALIGVTALSIHRRKRG
ncbi:MFS transporter [Heliobacterium gestii]|uniref:MFS transporter n=1 Tax=Heliomicrobium gestii TaxID=2699 RepID=A0A845L6Q1_HELGE|nr:MFS transporter [Heliomicrobium gestii]MBM7866934.1 TsgA-like MFS transporter [Heliomicrobium gestii]MZP42357.1 MFS transporter [Heliomicrobium gestii]